MPTQLREATRIARKAYRCSMCNGAIEAGTSHHVSTNLFDGRVYDWRTCRSCVEDNIVSEVYFWAGSPDEGVGFEQAWEWAHDHRDDPALGREASALLARCACKCERCAPEDGAS